MSVSIAIDHVVKKFGDNVIIPDLTANIKNGELFTLLAAPWVAGRFGPLAAISSGGATTFDTTLPILTRVAGPQYAVVAIFHGCVTDFSVPFLVTFFCSI